ncbi:MAG: accessory factor UbiK family protein [Gammaproteobacteria bacterium]|nr:accessory factor UbiK family protein [Gammaproteobacteria bacterium]
MNRRASLIDDLVQRVEKILPKEPRLMKEEMEEHLKAVLHSAFDKAELVTREEFDIQARVLARTRQSVDALKRQLESLEARLDQRDLGD